MNFKFNEQISTKTDSELLEIITNAEDYQDEFVSMAEAELQKRKINISKAIEQREQKHEQIEADLSEGKQGNYLYIALGFIIAFFGGFLSIIIGYIYSRSRQTSASGQKYYVYNQKTRDIGTVMMVIGIIAMIIYIVYAAT